MEDFVEMVYNLVDAELKRLSLDELTGIEFDIYSPEGSEALDLMEKYSLIKLRGENAATSIVDLTMEGRTVINVGGIRNYLKDKSLREILKEKKENLEVEKLTKEIKLLKSQLDDYRRNKLKANIAIMISAIALCLQLLSFLLTN